MEIYHLAPVQRGAGELPSRLTTPGPGFAASVRCVGPKVASPLFC